MSNIYSFAELGRHVAEETAEVREQLNFRMRTGVYSKGLVHELACHWVLRIYNVFSIYDEIEILEGSVRRRSMTKSAKKFRKPPLKGLWHKHHFQARFIPHNCLNGIEKEGYLQELLAPYSGMSVENASGAPTNKIIMSEFRQRAQAYIVTGEFIVYERQPDGSNYYLTLAEHSKWQEIRDRIDTYRALDQQANLI